jgi:hypothetical protein
MLGISVNAVKKRLQRGRELLKRTLTVAAVFLAIGLICIPVRGRVASLVRERLENMSKEETSAIAEDVGQADVDSFTREYTEEEKSRMRALYEQYEEGVFPVSVLPQVATVEEAEELGFCFLVPDSMFYLPDRELTDEELLEIIDFYAKRDYAVAEHAKEISAEETVAEEITVRKEGLESQTSVPANARNITEQEAVEAAVPWLEKVFGISQDGLEVNHYFDEETEIGGKTGFYQVNWTDFPGRQYFYFYLDAQDGSMAEIDYSSSAMVEYLDTFALTEEEMKERMPELEAKAVSFMEEQMQLSYTEIQYDYHPDDQQTDEGIKGAAMEKRVGFVFVQEDDTAYEVCYTWDGMFVMFRKIG